MRENKSDSLGGGKPQRPDYLKELRQKNAGAPVNNKHFNEVERLLNDSNLSAEQKAARLKSETERLEDMAKRKDKLLKYVDNDADREETAELYISSIKAKLALLNNQVQLWAAS